VMNGEEQGGKAPEKGERSGLQADSDPGGDVSDGERAFGASAYPGDVPIALPPQVLQGFPGFMVFDEVADEGGLSRRGGLSGKRSPQEREPHSPCPSSGGELSSRREGPVVPLVFMEISPFLLPLLPASFPRNPLEG